MQYDNFKLSGKTIDHAKAVAEAVVREVKAERESRGIDVAKNAAMYAGKHAQYFKPRMDEDKQVMKYRIDNPVVVNLVGFSVDLASRYLYGRSAKVTRKFSKAKSTNKAMLELLKKADIGNILLDASKKAAVFGEVLVRNVAVDELTGLQPQDKATETCYPQPVIMDPLSTYWKVNKWGKVLAVVVQYEAQDYVKASKRKITELIVEDSRWEWDEDVAVGLFGGVGDTFVAPGVVRPPPQYKASQNTYNLSDEFVHLPNNRERISDIEGILDLNISLDEALTDKKHFFNKHGWPQLVSEVNLQNVQHSPNKIWEILPDGVDDSKKVLDRLGFLTWDGKMADYEKFVKNLERQIFILSNTAAISTGDLEAIGQLRSGAALITAHSVAIHKTEAKQVIWERNELNLFSAMAKFDSYLHNEKFDARYRDFDPVIKFPSDFVPGAEHERAQIQQIQFNSHLKPLRDIIQENYPDADEDTIEAKYEEIMKDSENVVDSTREFISAPAEEGGTGQKGATGKSGGSLQKSKEQTKSK